MDPRLLPVSIILLPSATTIWHRCCRVHPREPFDSRVRPFLVGARAPDNTYADWVLKPVSKMGQHDSIVELVAARFARLVGIPVPDAAVIDVEASFVAKLQPRARKLLSANVGPNFGSRYLPGFNDVAMPAQVPLRERRTCGQFMCLDAVIDNPDRRDAQGQVKSNLLLGDTGLVGIDHQSAFSWFFDALQPGPVWKETILGRILTSHFVRTVLLCGPGALQALGTRIRTLTKEQIAQTADNLPAAWLQAVGPGLVPKIEAFLIDACSQVDTVVFALENGGAK
jgi:HipA-like protein